MSELTFDALLNRAYQLYQMEEYVQALDLLTREAGQFPEQAQTLYFWRICLAARARRMALAIQLLGEALAAGHWYPEAQLRGEEDLEPLQGLAEFEKLVEVSRQRHAAVQAKAVPLLLTLEPEKESPADLPSPPLLLALHGNRSNARSAVDHWRPAVDLGWLLALPQSSQVGGPEAYIWDDRDWAEREIKEHYAALREQQVFDPRRVVVGGFSLGGELAIWLALSGAIEARGFIAVGPGGPLMREPDNWIPLIEAGQSRGLRGYIVLGEQDAFCHDSAQALTQMLWARDIPCQLEVHPGLGHSFPREFRRSLARALEFILRD